MPPYKCPVCDGTGLVSRPPGLAGDVREWVGSNTGPYPCRACGGTGIIETNTGETNHNWPCEARDRREHYGGTP